MKENNISIIGCGVIGSLLAKEVDMGNIKNIKLKSVYDQNIDIAKKLVDGLSLKPVVCESVKEIYLDGKVDLVIESASQEAVRKYAVKILDAGKNLMVMSVGAFSDEKLFKQVMGLIKKKDRKLYIPSGAILGIDGIKAAKQAGIQKVILTTSKPPTTLSKTKYVQKKKLRLEKLSKKQVIFEGFAKEAVDAFPKSVNVASTLSLVGIGFDKTIVKVIADPLLKNNVHHIYVKGKAGEFVTKASNIPSPENPKTSYLAALSALRMLANLTDSIIIGT